MKKRKVVATLQERHQEELRSNALGLVAGGDSEVGSGGGGNPPATDPPRV
jgi:hypothetical protein